MWFADLVYCLQTLLKDLLTLRPESSNCFLQAFNYHAEVLDLLDAHLYLLVLQVLQSRSCRHKVLVGLNVVITLHLIVELILSGQRRQVLAVLLAGDNFVVDRLLPLQHDRRVRILSILNLL